LADTVDITTSFGGGHVPDFARRGHGNRPSTFTRLPPGAATWKSIHPGRLAVLGPAVATGRAGPIDSGGRSVDDLRARTHWIPSVDGCDVPGAGRSELRVRQCP